MFKRGIMRDLIPDEALKKITLRACKRIDVLCGLLKENDRVLDVGCGVGSYVSNLLGYLPVKITSIDLDRRSIEYARKNNPHKNVEFVVATGENYCSRKKFDLVVCSHILEHIAQPMMLLSNLQGLLKKDGILFVAVPNGFGSFELENFIPRMLCKVDWGEKLIRIIRGDVVKDSLNVDSQHINFFTIGKIIKLLNCTGWRVEKQINEEFLGGVVTDRILAKLPLLEKWNLVLGSRLPSQLANGWIFICRRDENG